MTAKTTPKCTARRCTIVRDILFLVVRNNVLAQPAMDLLKSVPGKPSKTTTMIQLNQLIRRGGVYCLPSVLY